MAINLGNLEKENYNNEYYDVDGLKLRKNVQLAPRPVASKKSDSKTKSHYNLLDDGYQFGDFTRMFLGEAKQGVNQLTDNIVNTPKNIINGTKKILNESEALKDGYQLGDGLKTIGSTLLSTGQNFGEGVISRGEQIIDAGADLTGGISDWVNTKLEKAVGLHKGKSEAEVNKEKAQSRRNMIETNYTDKLMKAVGKDGFYKDLIESNSLIKTDNMGGAIVQELGRQSLNLLMANKLNSSKLPNVNNKLGNTLINTYNKGLSSMPMLMGSYGSGLEEAYQNGATTSEARRYGLLNAATETATEWITGGIPGLKGTAGKGLDGLAEKLIGEGIEETSKSLSKALLKSGYKLVGEGTEEALSEFINPYLKQFTYEYNKNKGILGSVVEATKKVSPSDMFTSFIMGAITAGIIDSPNNISDIKAGIHNGKVNKINSNVSSNLNSNGNTSNLNDMSTNDINSLTQQNSSQSGLNVVNSDTGINSVYQYEKSDNQKIDSLRKSASQTLNNSIESKNLINAFEKIVQDKNYNVLLDNNLTSENGNFVNAQIKTLPNGETEIRINPNSDRAGEFLIMHEVTHAIETDDIKNLIVDYASKNKEFNESLESLKQTYGTNDVSSEVVADISGQLLGNQEFINSLSMEKPNVFKRIYNSIISLANKIIGNSKESLFLKDLKNKWQEAYRTQSNNLNETNFSIQTDNNGNKYVNVDTDQNIFDGIKPNEYNKIAKMYINDYLRGATNLSDNDTAIIDKVSANKYTNPGKKQPNFSEKMRLTPELKNVLQVSNKIKNAPPSKPNSKYQSWEYYKAHFKIENNFFEGLVNIGIDSEGNKHFYEVNCIKKTSGISDVSPNRPTGFSIDNISQSNSSVKSDTLSNKYSMQENKNNTWQEHLEKNYKATGTRTKMSDIKIGQMALRPAVESSKSRSIESKKQTSIKEINKQKIENNENAIKRLTQERDAFVERLQTKIKIKQELLKSKANQDTKLAAKLNMQISNLNNQIQNRKLDFERQIERYKNRNEKMNSEEFKIQEQRITKKQEYIDQAYEMTENMVDWKDKSKGIEYKVNTMERNLYDIMPKTEADKIYNNYFLPIKDNNSKLEKFINSYNERIKRLELNNEESVAIQMLGEYKYNTETLVTGPQVDQYISDHKLDYDKLSNAVEEFRTIYDELIVEVNKILKEQGYKEIEYKKGYFPHFQIETTQGKFSKLAEKLGFKINKNEQTLPTDIAGLTDLLKPGKTYFKNAQRRLGKVTDYNALYGFDNYIRGAADVIFHTEDIQKLRALEHVIRTQYTDSSVQQKLEEIYNNESLDQEQKQNLVDLEYSKINNPLPNLVTELRDYTDSLANKKDIGDRGMEHMLGRETYTIMKNVQSRVSANMVGFNISSALTNFIPITQAWGEVSSKNMLKAMKESVSNQIHDDGFADCSTYLINRTKQADRLYKTKLDNINSKAGAIFESVDSITSNVIVRGKYYDNIDKGMSQEQAIKNANRFAEQIMAGRGKGDMPTIFNRKNPLVKVFTAFQLEVNNQYGYMFKDLPRNLGDEAKKKLVGAFLKMFIGAWLYNKFSEKVTGRKSAFSPIDIVSESIQTVSNDNLSSYDKIKSVSTNMLQELPFVGGIMGGGRLSIEAAIPDVGTTVESLTQLTDSKKRTTAIKNLTKEISKPIFYVAMPFAGGQIKKTLEGASMYTHDLPGSYTSSGKLRFEAPKNFTGVAKSLIFGQYSSDNAKEYFDKGYMPLTEKQVKEIKDLNVSVKEYRKYREELTNLSKIKSDKDSGGKAVKGSSGGKKAYSIMNNDELSNKAKNYLLSQLSTSDTNETIDTLSKLPKDEEIYKYYYSLTSDNRKQMIKDMKEYDLSAYQLYDYYETKKEYKDTYVSSKAKEFIIDYLVSSNLTQKQKIYLYSKEYGSNDTVNLLNQFNINIDNYLNTIKYTSELKYQYQGERYSKYRRQQTYQYINSLKATVLEKAILFKQAGYSISNYKSATFDYIEALSLSKTEKNRLWNQLY